MTAPMPDITAFLLALLAIFAAAKFFGELAERIGQPAVLGEMVGGIAIGVSGLHLIDPANAMLQLFAQLGGVLLLFLIGLETDVRRLVSVGGAASAVAVTGVVLPLVCGYGALRVLGYDGRVSLFLAGCLTATSVAITARVLSDLGCLRIDEAQVILGAAVLDDILSLVLLTIVTGVASGQRVAIPAVVRTAGLAFGFVVAAVVVGSRFAPALLRAIARLRVSKALFFASLTFAFGFACLASLAGTSTIIGAFAAGVVLARTSRARDIEREVHNVAHFFVPVFFVLVGASIDLHALSPFTARTRPAFVAGVVLTIVASLGKIVTGLVAYGRPLRRLVIGIGMIPHGEVELVFAQIGLAIGVLSPGLFGAVAMMVMVTTLVTPPALRRLLATSRAAPDGGRTELATLLTESIVDDEDAAPSPDVAT